MQVIRSYRDLVEALRGDHVPHNSVDPKQAVEFLVNRPPLHTTAVIVWDSRVVLVQFLVPLQLTVAAERMPMVESAVARLNHVLILPGFGINHTTNCVYYRSVLSRRVDGAIEYEEIKRGLITATNTAHDYFSLLSSVAVEGADPSQILDGVSFGKRDEDERAKQNKQDREILGVPGSLLGIGDDN